MGDGEDRRGVGSHGGEDTPAEEDGPPPRRRYSRQEVIATGLAGAAGLVGVAGLLREILRDDDVSTGQGESGGRSGGGAAPGGEAPAAVTGPATSISGRFESAVQAREVGYVVVLPPDYRAEEPLPVAFLLHGRHEDSRWFVEQLRVQEALAAGVAAGDLGRFALAAVDGGDLWWHERPVGNDPLAMFLDEFVPRCEADFRLGGPPARRAVAGWSMGALGALLAAQRRPGEFAAVAVSSPAVFATFARAQQAARGAFDDARDFAENDAVAGAPTMPEPVRVDCGTEDPLAADARALADALPERTRSAEFTPGGHDIAYWRRALPAQLRFLSAALA
jgi:enterochelin esterase-like enzyme